MKNKRNLTAVLCFVLAAVFIFSAAGCSKNDPTASSSPQTRSRTDGTAQLTGQKGSDTEPTLTTAGPAYTEDDGLPSVFPGFDELEKYAAEHLAIDREQPRYDGKHINGYIGVFSDFTNYFFCDYLIENPNYEKNSMLGFAEECNNYGFFIDYYAVPEQEFRNALVSYYENNFSSLEAFVTEDNYPLIMYKEWYKDDYIENPAFLTTEARDAEYKTVTVRPEGEDSWTDLYYTVDYRLIKHVGKDKFESFKKKYGGTTDFNIVKFIDEMDIGLEDYRKIYKDYYASIGAGRTFYPYPESIFREAFDDDNISELAKDREYADKLFEALGRHPYNNKNDPLRTSGNRDAKHVEGYSYYDYENFWKELIDEKDFIKYMDMFICTEDTNTGAIIDYFSISREEYLDAVKKMKEWLAESGGIGLEVFDLWAGELAERADDWFAEDYADRESFVLDGYEYPADRTVIRIPENCQEHTARYHTIDHTLIEMVGAEKFKEFEDKYAGTEDFNVLNFIEYFGITEQEVREKFASELLDVFKCMPYSPYFLFADPEIQNEYFTKNFGN